jgi:dTDP-4-dehydrorhamnose reductase
MKRLIVGNGKVSNVIRHEGDVILSRPIIDIRSQDSIRAALDEHKPDILINCAAKTNLEECQDNKGNAFQTNSVGTSNLLVECAERKIKFVHISSGCLFDGNKELSTEDSIPTPRVWYTWTKLWADQFILNYGYQDFLILRPRQLFSAFPSKSNLITKFASMSSIKAIKENNSATCIEDLGLMIDHLIGIDARGVFNCANEGFLSPYDMAVEIRDRMNPKLQVDEISYEGLLKILPNTRVNTILSLEKLKSTGFTPRSAHDALVDCIQRYGK